MLKESFHGVTELPVHKLRFLDAQLREPVKKWV